MITMSGRGHGSGRGQFGGRFKSGWFNRTNKTKDESTKARKTLADYNNGTNKMASEFEVVSQ
jgi:hypothetical protein